MANKELHSVITIDNEDYSITANKVAQSLTIGEKTYDGSSAVQITATDLGLDNAVKTTRTITTGDGLSGGGDLSADRTFSVVVGNGITIVSDAVTAKAGNGITVDATGINHADTSSQASITAEGRKYITGVTLDTYGHVTGLTTGTETGGSSVAGATYLGTVSALAGLLTTAKAGDFYRVSTTFTFGSETAHVGDILIATKDNPTQNTTDWDLLHAEIDSNTWTANSATADGYVAKTNGAANKVWKTNASGVPSWQDDTAHELISHGTDDPSTSTTSKYYFKY